MFLTLRMTRLPPGQALRERTVMMKERGEYLMQEAPAADQPTTVQPLGVKRLPHPGSVRPCDSEPLLR